MANRQTRSLMAANKGTRANRLPGGGSPTIIARPRLRGRACDSSFANAPSNGNKHKHAHLYRVDTNMTVKIQAEMCGHIVRRAE